MQRFRLLRIAALAEAATLLVLVGVAVPLKHIGGHSAAVRRIPGKKDFRSNIHAGGRAEPGIITSVIRDIAAKVGPQLVKDGLFLAGLDIIGNKIIEINVFSTGGIYPAEQFEGVDFTGMIIQEIENRHEGKNGSQRIAIAA